MKTWIRVARADDVMRGGGGCVKLGGVQVALFKVPQLKGPNGTSHT